MTGHYLFEPELCNVASGWEKGIVEKNVRSKLCCSTRGLRRMSLSLSSPQTVNTNDDSAAAALLPQLFGIPENRTDVAIEHSWESYDANVKHTYYDLFQKQGIVANKDQPFYRAMSQNLLNR